MWLKYSHQQLSSDGYLDRIQQYPVSDFCKPQGCWITDDSDQCWRSWCVGENFSLGQLTHKHEVVLDESNILILRSVLDLDYFTLEYSRNFLRDGSDRGYRTIDWPSVAQTYDGLIITPYQWSRRLERDFNWYYGWDCASGCIWRARAIREIRLIEIDHEIAKRPQETQDDQETV